MFAASKTAGAVSAEVNYIEDVFSTYLYTGSSGTVTNTNNIDISGKGGLVWVKNRSAGTTPHMLADTARGGQYTLNTDTTLDQGNQGAYGFTFSSTGFSLPNSFPELNTSGNNYTSWTFRKQPKFFDVVTYTGTGSATTIAHSLGSVPGCIIIKRTDTTSDWSVYHQSLQSTPGLENRGVVFLNATNAVAYGSTYWNATAPTSTVFSLGSNAAVNASGGTYVAYLFAHNAGGFGLTGTDNVISCGSFTTDASGNATVSLGYEPQWIMAKSSDSATDWYVYDSMRGFTYDSTENLLFPNRSDAERTDLAFIRPRSNGFYAPTTNPSKTYIYIAIRRGPMKVPTSGTSVFKPATVTESGNTVVTTTGFPVDMLFTSYLAGNAKNAAFGNRLTNANSLSSSSTRAELSADFYSGGLWDSNTTSTGNLLGSGNTIKYFLRRAPSFFDVVCYTGTGTINGTISHNLGVAPELIILKPRTAALAWSVWTDFTSSDYIQLALNTTSFAGSRTSYSTTARLGAKPTSTTLTFGVVDNYANGSANTYVAYLFATCAGVSKVGSYTGNGTTQTINCGFTGGARFVLIKRTDSTGDWYVYDTARGMTTLTDPYLLLNSTAAESATLGSVTTVSTGFAVNASILAAINTNAASYIFLAIA